MGLFDKMLGGREAGSTLTPAEAYSGILLSAVAADGHIADEEAQGLYTITARMKLYQDWAPDKFRVMMDKLLKILKREGLDKLMSRSAQALPDELKEPAFANACDLVLADGTVEDEERAVVDRLQRLLGVSGDMALTIVDVMIIKNRG